MCERRGEWLGEQQENRVDAVVASGQFYGEEGDRVGTEWQRRPEPQVVPWTAYEAVVVVDENQWSGWMGFAPRWDSCEDKSMS